MSLCADGGGLGGSGQGKGWQVDLLLQGGEMCRESEEMSTSIHGNLFKEPQRMEFGEQEGSQEAKSRVSSRLGMKQCSDSQ